jgi:hypothetical protein
MPKASVQPISGSPRRARAKRPQMISETGVKYEIVTVTPGQAALWLGKNVANRRLRPAVGDRYARDMAADAWKENGAAVVFASDGTLIDGQHRLQASVDSGAPFTTLVVTNVDKHVQNTIDDGAKRTLADRFTFEGRANASTAAAVVRRVLLWRQGVPLPAEHRREVPGAEVTTPNSGRHAAERTRRIAMKQQQGLVALVGTALTSAVFLAAAATPSPANGADTNAPRPPQVHSTITGW